MFAGGNLGIQWTAYCRSGSRRKNWRDKNYRSVAELTEKIDFQGEIYFVEKANGGNTKWMQWWIPATPIHIIDLEEFDNLYQQGILKEALVLSNTRDGSTTGKLSDSMHYVYDSGEIGIFVQPNSQLESQVMGQAAACYEYPDPHWYEVDLSVASTSLCERKPGGNLYHAQGKEGYLTWETGLSLEDGQYEFVLEMEIHGEGNIGYGGIPGPWKKQILMVKVSVKFIYLFLPKILNGLLLEFIRMGTIRFL